MEPTNREEYKRISGLIYASILEKLRSGEEKEYQDFLRKIIEISERSFRSLIFKDFREVEFKKEITKNNILFWLEKASLALISYSYYSIVSVKEWHHIENLYVNNIPYEDFFETILKHYNSIFGSNANWEDIIYYGAGYKEIIEKREEEDPGNLQHLKERDYRVIGGELLAGIWGEDIDESDYYKKKGTFLGNWIKKTHEKLVIPFLKEITLNPKKT